MPLLLATSRHMHAMPYVVIFALACQGCVDARLARSWLALIPSMVPVATLVAYLMLRSPFCLGRSATETRELTRPALVYWRVALFTALILTFMHVEGVVATWLNSDLPVVTGQHLLRCLAVSHGTTAYVGLKPAKAWIVVAFGALPIFLLQPLAAAVPGSWEYRHPSEFAVLYMLNAATSLAVATLSMITCYGDAALARDVCAGHENLLQQAALTQSLLETAMPCAVARLQLDAGSAESRELTSRSFRCASIAFFELEDYAGMIRMIDARADASGNESSDRDAPAALISWLDRIYTSFDELLDAYGELVNKIEIVANTYIVSTGLPLEHPGHACVMAAFCLDILALCCTGVDGIGPVRVRIGVHSGPVTAGIIGVSRRFYRVFGDTVNVASRMMSTGESGRVHASAAFTEALIAEREFGVNASSISRSARSPNNAAGATGSRVDISDDISATPRGQMFVKGKGLMQTFWIVRGTQSTTIDGRGSTSGGGSLSSARSSFPATVLPAPIHPTSDAKAENASAAALPASGPQGCSHSLPQHSSAPLDAPRSSAAQLLELCTLVTASAADLPMEEKACTVVDRTSHHDLLRAMTTPKLRDVEQRALRHLPGQMGARIDLAYGSGESLGTIRALRATGTALGPPMNRTALPQRLTISQTPLQRNLHQNADVEELFTLPPPHRRHPPAAATSSVGELRIRVPQLRPPRLEFQETTARDGQLVVLAGLPGQPDDCADAQSSSRATPVASSSAGSPYAQDSLSQQLQRAHDPSKSNRRTGSVASVVDVSLSPPSTDNAATRCAVFQQRQSTSSVGIAAAAVTPGLPHQHLPITIQKRIARGSASPSALPLPLKRASERYQQAAWRRGEPGSAADASRSPQISEGSGSPQPLLGHHGKGSPSGEQLTPSPEGDAVDISDGPAVVETPPTIVVDASPEQAETQECCRRLRNYAIPAAFSDASVEAEAQAVLLAHLVRNMVDRRRALGSVGA